MDLLPISALQHLLYCERQCALIHVEREWKENYFTATGRVLHERAHEGPDESRPGVRITRGLPVRSERLGLSGQCDVVEFHEDGSVVVVEYKRGKPKSHRADEVQLCAQALCLEETLGKAIPAGFLFYGQSKRRMDIAFDASLRSITEKAAQRLHEMIASSELPPAVYDRKKCGACSLIEPCQPRIAGSASRWFARELSQTLAETLRSSEP